MQYENTCAQFRYTFFSFTPLSNVSAGKISHFFKELQSQNFLFCDLFEFGPCLGRYIYVNLQLTFESRKQGDPKKTGWAFLSHNILYKWLEKNKFLNFRREYIYSFLSSHPSISCKTLSKISGFTTSIQYALIYLTSSGTQLCLYIWVDPIRLEFFNQSKKIPMILLISPIKIWGKSVQEFMSYDRKSSNKFMCNVC